MPDRVNIVKAYTAIYNIQQRIVWGRTFIIYCKIQDDEVDILLFLLTNAVLSQILAPQRNIHFRTLCLTI